MKRLLTGALALALLAGTTAMAQPNPGDRADHRNDQGGYTQDHRNGPGGDRPGNDHQGNDRQGVGYGQGSDHRGDHHGWARGQHLPRDYYRDRSHFVDYRANHLRRPPSGYRWVRTDDNNYAMVAITSGLIASIIAGNR